MVKHPFTSLYANISRNMPDLRTLSRRSFLKTSILAFLACVLDPVYTLAQDRPIQGKPAKRVILPVVMSHANVSGLTVPMQFPVRF